MRLKRHVPLLESTLKHLSARPFLSSQCSRYLSRYSSSSATYPEQIAVLGAGITGLASAHFVAKEFPNSKITVFEKGEETGGWLTSRRVHVPGGDVLFEYGARTLRPSAASLPTAQLIQDLDLVPELTFTKSTSPAAQNRYIYYPDRLNRLPSGGFPGLLPLFDLVRSGILDGAQNALAEAWQPKRPSNMTDESIGSFLSRRVDKRIANNIVSPVFHGIYAGDIWQLSARTLLSLAWKLEGQYGSILMGLKALVDVNVDAGLSVMPTLVHPYDSVSLKAMQDEIKLESDLIWKLADCSTFTFKNGLQQLPNTLYDTLKQNKQVEIKMGTPANSFDLVSGSPEQVKVITGEGESRSEQKFDLVISTLRNKALTDYVTVMTVNLYFKNPSLLPVRGFGYLIPQSVPFEQNPERALGVIFDSDAVQGQDTVEGTKLTVMLGGHWWNGWEGYPDSDEGAELAKSVLQRHLGITDEPTVCHVNLHHDCIPQYTVGYEDRVKEFAVGLQDQFHGKVRVAGNQYNGVGVNDCVKGAWHLARSLRGNGWKERSCGLDRFLDERAWLVEQTQKHY